MYFRAIDVWQRIDQRSVKRYRCFEILHSKRYCVQSVDFYNLPFDLKQVEGLNHQFLELLAEQAPDERNSTYETLQEAIRQHEKDFAETTD